MRTSEPADENEWRTINFDHKYPRAQFPLLYSDEDSCEIFDRIVGGTSVEHIASYFGPGRKPDLKQSKECLDAEFNPRASAIVWIVLGMPGVDKSALIRARTTENAAIEISPDVAKRDPLFAKDFDGGRGSSALHKECCLIAESAMNVAITQRRSIVHPMIGEKYELVTKIIGTLRAAGYHVVPELADASPTTALKRVALHFYQTGCLIPFDYLQFQIANNPAKNYLKLLEHGLVDPNQWRVLDNEESESKEPRLLSPVELRDRISAREKIATEQGIAFLRKKPFDEESTRHIARLLIETLPARALREALDIPDEIRATPES